MQNPQFISAEGGLNYVFAYQYPISQTTTVNGTTTLFSGFQLVFIDFRGQAGYCGSSNGAVGELFVDVSSAVAASVTTGGSSLGSIKVWYVSGEPV